MSETEFELSQLEGMSVASSFIRVTSESLFIFGFCSTSSAFFTKLSSAVYSLNSRGVGFVFLDGLRWNLSTD